MKLKWILPLLCCGLLFSCDQDDYPNADIPSVVLNKFRSNYPEASDIEWQQINGNYEVDFEVHGTDGKLLIEASGDILKNKQEISLEMLPRPVIYVLEEEFGKEKIDDPEVVTTKDISYYQVAISQFIFDKELVIDEQGVIMDSVSYWD